MRLRHLLSIQDLETAEIQSLLDKAHKLRETDIDARSFSRATGFLFLENSTRTRLSFERACQKLGKPVVDVLPDKSSLEKGESIADTLDNLHALECDQIIVRCTNEKILQDLANESDLAIINAGDGSREHPTQALLDLLTLWDGPADLSLKKLQSLRIGIVGDLVHSRVAQSWAELAPKMSLDVRFYSPAEWKPVQWEKPYKWSSNFKKDLPDLDVLMALRVQKERITNHSASLEHLADFADKYQVSTATLSKNVPWLMHPGPINWGVELHEDLKDYPKSLILKQVNFGLYLRAVLIEMFSAEGHR